MQSVKSIHGASSFEHIDTSLDQVFVLVVAADPCGYETSSGSRVDKLLQLVSIVGWIIHFAFSTLLTGSLTRDPRHALGPARS